MVVDTLGLVWGLLLTPAAVPDWDGGREAMLRARKAAPRVTRVYADSAYRACEFWAVGFARVVLFVVRKPAGPGLTVQPKRWVVERTCGWLGKWRRLSKDYERTCEGREAFVTAAMIGLMARRLRPAGLWSGATAGRPMRRDAVGGPGAKPPTRPSARPGCGPAG